MDYLASEILELIKAHPEWAAVVIGLVAFGESFVFFSLLFPGTAILIASGALIEAGILDPLSPALAGILGAVLGDAISFWLGQKFGPFLSTVWPFRRHPERLENGISFFERYGTSSVFMAGSLVLFEQSFLWPRACCTCRRRAFTSPMSYRQ